MNNLYLIIGPSGSGKTRLADGLSRKCGMKSVESYTTRSPRYPGEPGHIFVSDDEFDRLGELFAYTEYNGHRYGVTKDILDGSDIYVIDPDGAIYLAEHYSGKPLRYIWLSTSPGICFKRMLLRGDSEEKANERIKNDESRFSMSKLADVRTKMTGVSIVTDKYAPAQVLSIARKKISDFECLTGLDYFERSCSGLLEDE